jgi:hypothetical protein
MQQGYHRGGVQKRRLTSPGGPWGGSSFCGTCVGYGVFVMKKNGVTAVEFQCTVQRWRYQSIRMRARIRQAAVLNQR